MGVDGRGQVRIRRGADKGGRRERWERREKQTYKRSRETGRTGEAGTGRRTGQREGGIGEGIKMREGAGEGPVGTHSAGTSHFALK